MNFHGDLSRHVIRNYLCELMNSWIYGYGGVWIYGYVMNPSFVVEIPFNRHQMLFVEFPSLFVEQIVKCSVIVR